jgi:hypothetical protein
LVEARERAPDRAPDLTNAAGVSTLPSPSAGIRVVFVSDALNGAGKAGQLAYSNGVQWVDFRGDAIGIAPLELLVPYGAAGLWAIDQYSATPSPHIANSMSTKLVSQAVNRFPRRSFSSDQFFRSNVVAVDSNLADPFSGTEASVITGTGNWKILPNSPAGLLPAGTYTAAAWVKSNTGGNQFFAFTKDSAATRSAVKTATLAWQRFTYTFALAAPTGEANVGVVSSDGATNGDLQVIDFEIFPGSSDLGLGVNNAAGHAYFGDTAYQAQTYAAGVKTAGYASLQLDTPFLNAAFTFVILAKVTALNTYNGILAEINSFGPLTLQTPTAAGIVDVTQSGTLFKNDVAADTTVAADAWQYPPFQNALDSKYRQYAFTYTAGVVELWINDVRFARWEKVLAPYTFANLWLNAVNRDNPSANTLAGFAGLWSRKLSDSEMRATFDRNKERAAASSVVVDSDSTDRLLAVEGDSITTGSANYPSVYCNGHDSPAVWASMWAVTGSTLANLNQRAPYVDALIPPSKNGRKFLLSVLIGANDLGTYTGGAAQYITDLRAYCMARVAAGYKVALGTILPVDGDANHNSRRATVNTDIRTNWAYYGLSSAAAVFDFAADAIMGPDNSRTTNPTYWADGIHPSAALGQVRLETIYRPVINAL